MLLPSRSAVVAACAALLACAPALAQADLRTEPELLDRYYPNAIVYPGYSWADVEIRVYNRGDETAEPSRGALYMSSDGTLSADDVLVSTFYVPRVFAGRWEEATAYNVVFPEVGAEPGLYALIVEVDTDNTVPETDETNNTTFFALHLGGEGTNVTNIEYNFGSSPTYTGPGAPGAPGGFWNALTTTSGSLLESDGETPSPVGVYFQSNARARGGSGLLGDYIGSSGQSPFRVRGLRSAERFDIYVYSSGGALITLDGQTQTIEPEAVSGFVEGVNYTVFRGVQPNEDGVAEGTIEPLPGDLYYGVSGVQVFESVAASVSEEAPPSAAVAAALEAPVPNPSRGEVTLAYVVGRAVPVRLTVVDALGREVAALAEGVVPLGRHAHRVDTGRLAPGVYVVRLEAGGDVLTRSFTVVR